MKKFFIAFALLLTSWAVAHNHLPKHYLQGKIPKKNFRYQTFYHALHLMKERDVKVIVETGTSRNGSQNFEGDGGSTIIFASWAMDNKAQFYSVDLNNEYLKNAKKAVKEEIGSKLKGIHFVCSDSLEFLRKFDRKIDFLYLDSYDFEESNPLPSQYHHLYEIQAAYPFLTENSVVMIDDCGLPYGGKGKLAIAFLLERGWKIVNDQYQVILVYKK